MKVNRDDYSFEPLGNHALAAFSCHKKPLENYIKQTASQDVRRNLAAVFVAVKRKTRKVVGYYSLSNFAMRLDQLPPEFARQVGRYSFLPVTLLGRMAVSDEERGKAIGELLLMDALAQVLEGSRRVASWALFVEAKDKEAQSFYKKYEFIELPEDKLKLFLPMKTIKALLS